MSQKISIMKKVITKKLVLMQVLRKVEELHKRLNKIPKWINLSQANKFLLNMKRKRRMTMPILTIGVEISTEDIPSDVTLLQQRDMTSDAKVLEPRLQRRGNRERY